MSFPRLYVNVSKALVCLTCGATYLASEHCVSHDGCRPASFLGDHRLTHIQERPTNPAPQQQLVLAISATASSTSVAAGMLTRAVFSWPSDG